MSNSEFVTEPNTPTDPRVLKAMEELKYAQSLATEAMNCAKAKLTEVHRILETLIALGKQIKAEQSTN